MGNGCRKDGTVLILLGSDEGMIEMGCKVKECDVKSNEKEDENEWNGFIIYV